MKINIKKQNVSRYSINQFLIVALVVFGLSACEGENVVQSSEIDNQIESILGNEVLPEQINEQVEEISIVESVEFARDIGMLEWDLIDPEELHGWKIKRHSERSKVQISKKLKTKKNHEYRLSFKYKPRYQGGVTMKKFKKLLLKFGKRRLRLSMYNKSGELNSDWRQVEVLMRAKSKKSLVKFIFNAVSDDYEVLVEDVAVVEVEKELAE